MSDKTDVTDLLRRWHAGDEQALDRLMPIVYDELHRIASAAFRRERRDHSLQPTAVINEAYLQLVGTDVDWQNRKHFFALAARMMRRFLVNHAAARNAEKRGGGRELRTFVESRIAGLEDERSDVLDLDAAIASLAAQEERKADIVELHYSGGFTYEQIGDVLSLSPATVKRDLRFARAWITRFLDTPTGEPN